MPVTSPNTKLIANQDAEQPGIEPGIIVILLPTVGDALVKAGTVKLEGIYTLQRTIHGFTLLLDSPAGQVVTCIRNIEYVCSYLA